MIDASGSMDADGDALTITITQTSGPEASIAPDAGSDPDADGVWRFTAPLVDLDSVLVFRITLSDGRATSVETVEVNVSNVVLEPATTLLESYDLNITAPDGARELHQFIAFASEPQDAIKGLAGLPGEPLSFFYLRRSPDEYEQVGMGLPLAGTTADQRSYFDLGRFSSGRVGGAYSLEADDKIVTVEPTFTEPETFVLGVEIPANAPCAIQSSRVFRDSSAAWEDIFVAERGAGLHYRLSSEDPDNAIGYDDKVSISDTGSYCEFEMADLDGAGFSADIVAIDVDSLSFATFVEFLGGNYIRIVSEPLDFTSEVDLSVFGFAAFALGDPKFFAVGLTDGQEVGGDHRLLVYGSVDDGSGIASFELAQELKWTDGAPIKLLLQPVGDGVIIMAVAVPSSPSLRIYEGVRPDPSVAAPVFREATFLDVGGPVTDIARFAVEGEDRLGLMALIGEQNRIRTYAPPAHQGAPAEKVNLETGIENRFTKSVEPPPG